MIEFLNNPAAQAAVERKIAFNYPEFTVGANVGIRYKREAYGEIVAIRCKGSTNKFASTAPFAVVEMRMEDGTIRHEHPEHLFQAKQVTCKDCGCEFEDGQSHFMPTHKEGPVCLGCLDLPPGWGDRECEEVLAPITETHGGQP